MLCAVCGIKGVASLWGAGFIGGGRQQWQCRDKEGEAVEMVFYKLPYRPGDKKHRGIRKRH